MFGKQPSSTLIPPWALRITMSSLFQSNIFRRTRSGSPAAACCSRVSWRETCQTFPSSLHLSNASSFAHHRMKAAPNAPANLAGSRWGRHASLPGNRLIMVDLLRWWRMVTSLEYCRLDGAQNPTETRCILSAFSRIQKRNSMTLRLKGLLCSRSSCLIEQTLRLRFLIVFLRITINCNLAPYNPNLVRRDDIVSILLAHARVTISAEADCFRDSNRWVKALSLKVQSWVGTSARLDFLSFLSFLCSVDDVSLSRQQDSQHLDMVSAVDSRV